VDMSWTRWLRGTLVIVSALAHARVRGPLLRSEGLARSLLLFPIPLHQPILPLHQPILLFLLVVALRLLPLVEGVEVGVPVQCPRLVHLARTRLEPHRGDVEAALGAEVAVRVAPEAGFRSQNGFTDLMFSVVAVALKISKVSHGGDFVISRFRA